MLCQRLHDRLGQERDAVLLAFAVAHRHLQLVENRRVDAIREAEGIDTKFSHLDIPADAANAINKYAMRTMREDPLRLAKKLAVQSVTFWYLGNTRVKTLAILIFQLVFVVPWLFVGLLHSFTNRIALVLPLLLMIFYLNITYAATIGLRTVSGIPTRTEAIPHAPG